LLDAFLREPGMTTNKKKNDRPGKNDGGKKKTAARKQSQEKRAACVSKRPKSREETPKEGSDSARRYRTAPICDRAAQKARVFVTFSVQKNGQFHRGSNLKSDFLLSYFICLNNKSGDVLRFGGESPFEKLSNS
jgi:hypothetical protein